MYRHLLFAVPALILATSCVPQDAPQQASAAPAHPSAPALLRQLDLKIPADLAKSALPASNSAPYVVLSPAAPPFLAQTQSSEDATRAIDCLTAAVYYEARSQSDDGERAVAQVVLNRVRDRAFPSSVCGVVYQGSERRTGCQFSFTCDGSMNRATEPNAWARAREIAISALSGAVYAPVGSATFYHADYVLPWWAASMSRIVQIGAHIFYRWSTPMERALAFRQSYSGSEPSISATWTAPSAAPELLDGGLQIVFGVTIHRDGIPPSSDAPRAIYASGVRIHRGAMAAPADDSGEPDANGAILSEESAPI